MYYKLKKNSNLTAMRLVAIEEMKIETFSLLFGKGKIQTKPEIIFVMNPLNLRPPTVTSFSLFR